MKNQRYLLQLKMKILYRNELTRGRAIEVSSGKKFFLIDENLRFSNFPLNPEAERRGIL